MPLALPALMTLLAVLWYFYTLIHVAGAHGKYKVSLKIASGAAQNREFEFAADETWGLLAGPAGVPLPVHLY